MRIRTRFYYQNKGGNYVYGGWMLLKNRQITQLGKLPLEDRGRRFYFDETYHTIHYSGRLKKGSVDANIIITEEDYRTSQAEYFVRLDYLQQQKLLWMFRRHWLQQPGNVVHIAILFLIITLAFVGFEYMHHRF